METLPPTPTGIQNIEYRRQKTGVRRTPKFNFSWREVREPRDGSRGSEVRGQKALPPFTHRNTEYRIQKKAKVSSEARPSIRRLRSQLRQV